MDSMTKYTEKKYIGQNISDKIIYYYKIYWTKYNQTDKIY